ncbi:MAG: 5-(carboxyamino)imidazole ribonucleotide synthase, partial [Caldimonas sp.]
DDVAALDRLAASCAAVTTEFENVPAVTLERLASRLRVSPPAAAVAVCQDRVAEKAAFTRSGVACAPHAVLESTADLAAVDADIFPAILKTARLGYDGKGQRSVGSPADLAAAFAALGSVTCVLEKRLPLAAEISVIVARGGDGAVVHLPVQENEHRDGILVVTRVPPRCVPAVQQVQAIAMAEKLAASLDYVGVLCVEFFVLDDGSLVANEMAPRPHNSGHYSIDACDLSQFELQVRTLTGAPLLPPRLHSPCRMLNLLGDLWWAGDASAPPREPDWAAVLALPGAHLHLYGKAEARRGRKMGHLTITAATAPGAESVAADAARRLGLMLA